MAASLEDKINKAGSAVKMLRTSPALMDTGPVTGREFSNWRDEGLSWRESCALFDLSHHMTDLTVSGPDSLKLLSMFGVNSLSNFQIGKAKQIIATNEDGYVIGDVIADYMGEDNIRLAGSPPVADWLQYQVETGDFDVDLVREEPTGANPNGHPDIYRYQVNGPFAMEILNKVNGGPVEDVKFFNATTLSVGNLRVRALAHNMSRAKGLELMGPWADAQEVLHTLLQAGEEFGLKRVGSRGPTPGTLESGWLPAPIPAIYSGESMKAYREWLPASSYEGSGSLGGSFGSDDISDFYLEPRDMNYDRLVNFDHDFLGSDALRTRAAEPRRRRKVTLAWNTEDVLRIIATGFEKGTPARQLEFPIAQYATWQYDSVMLDGQTVGVSTTAGYTYNERRMLSLAVVDDSVAEGTEVTVVWGEESGGDDKIQLETHVQTEVRAIVSPVPYSEVFYK